MVLFSPGSCWAFWQTAVLKLDISSVCGQTYLVFFWIRWCYNHQNQLSKESLSLLRGLNYNSVAFRCLKCLTVKNHSHFQNRLDHFFTRLHGSPKWGVLESDWMRNLWVHFLSSNLPVFGAFESFSDSHVLLTLDSSFASLNWVQSAGDQSDAVHLR